MHLVLDWDGTLTQKDTLHFLSRAALFRHPNAQAQWDQIVKDYTADYSAHVSSYSPSKAERHTLAEEKAWLRGLADVERRSVQRVEQSGLFRGVTAKDLETVASEVVRSGELKLRKGWEALFLRTQESGNVTDIVSVNWSRHFVRAALSAASDHSSKVLSNTRANSTAFSKCVEAARIAANEVEGIEDEGGSNGMTGSQLSAEKQYRTSADKLRGMQALKSQHAGTYTHETVYIGDSATDLECLMDADIGVCIRDEPMSSGQQELADMLVRIGVEVICIEDAESRRMTERGRVLLWAANFEHVSKLV